MTLKKSLPAFLVVFTLIATNAFGFVGFGLQVPFDIVSVSSSTEGTPPVSLERQGFNNAFGVGGYIYIDAIPIIDLEADFHFAGRNYDFQFKNAIADLSPTPFAWSRFSGYLTVRKKLFGLGLPVLGGIKLHAGAGVNWHTSTPYASLDMVEEFLDGNLEDTFEPKGLEDFLIDYLKENKVNANGFHIQTGVQLRLLMVDMFVNYRLTMSEDVYQGEKSWSSLNLLLGIGF